MKKIFIFLILVCTMLLVSCVGGLCSVNLIVHLYLEDPDTNTLLTKDELENLIVTSNVNVAHDSSHHHPAAQCDEEGNYYILLAKYLGSARTEMGIKKLENSYSNKVHTILVEISDPVNKTYKPYSKHLDSSYEPADPLHSHLSIIKYRIKLEKN